MNSRYAVFTDFQWELIAPFMPDSTGRTGRPFKDHRLVVEGIIYRYRAGIPWRDLPAHFGIWKTVWKRHRRHRRHRRHCRHRRYAGDGTSDTVLATMMGHAQAKGLIDWEVSVDSTVNRAHQHGTNLPRHTGGTVE